MLAFLTLFFLHLFPYLFIFKYSCKVYIVSIIENILTGSTIVWLLRKLTLWIYRNAANELNF